MILKIDTFYFYFNSIYLIKHSFNKTKGPDKFLPLTFATIFQNLMDLIIQIYKKGSEISLKLY
jgi:hypothetical protein